jgi:hypothetical protein
LTAKVSARAAATKIFGRGLNNGGGLLVEQLEAKNSARQRIDGDFFGPRLAGC